MVQFALISFCLFFPSSMLLADEGSFPVENFHEVDPGQYYRSAQLSAEDLDAKISEYHIKTVLNLRGEALDESWFQGEKAATEKRNVRLVSIARDGNRLPHRSELITIIETLDSAPRPILVHCYAGADRTGEVSAIYEFDYLHKSKDEALEMLSYYYLHFDFVTEEPTYFVKDVYQGHEWALKTYDPCVQKYDYYDQEKYCPHS